MELTIEKDELISRFILETPIDGYGKPNIWLTFQIKNGPLITGFNKKYQSGINFGKDGKPQDTLFRIIDSFSNEEGYVELRDKLEHANNSWASVGEIVNIIKFIWNLSLTDLTPEHASSINQRIENKIKINMLRELEEKTGDLRAIYSVTDLDNLSSRKQRSLPSKMSVYELIKFASKKTEILIPPAKRRLLMIIGNMLSREYDLEDSKDQFPEFNDFFAKEPEEDPADWWKHSPKEK
jgi:hypothetical protein